MHFTCVRRFSCILWWNQIVLLWNLRLFWKIWDKLIRMMNRWLSVGRTGSPSLFAKLLLVCAYTCFPIGNVRVCVFFLTAFCWFSSESVKVGVNFQCWTRYRRQQQMTINDVCLCAQHYDDILLMANNLKLIACFYIFFFYAFVYWLNLMR